MASTWRPVAWAASRSGHTRRETSGRSREETGLAYRSLALSPDGHTLALVCSDRSIRLWDLASMEETRRLLGISDELRAVEFSPDGALIAASTFGGEFRVWDLRSADPQPIQGAVPEAVQSFVFLPGSRTLAIAQSGQGQGRLPLGSGNREASGYDSPTMVGATIACHLARRQDPGLGRWTGRSASGTWRPGSSRGRFMRDVGWVKTLAFSPDGRRIAFGGRSASSSSASWTGRKAVEPRRLNASNRS